MASRGKKARKHPRRRSASATLPAVGSMARRAPAPVAGEEGVGFGAFVSAATSAAAKIGLIRSGVVARVVNDMVEYLDVPKAEIFRLLHTPESTAHRLIRDNRTLDAAASERVVRVADVARMAQETLGGREAAARWLKTANQALGGATPLSLLDTEPGAGEVRRILTSIGHGGTL